MGVDASPVILVVLALAAALVLVILGWWAFSRYAAGPQNAAPPIPCGYREGPDRSWVLGLVHYDRTQLVHRTSQGRSWVERHRWDRVHLNLGYAERVRDQGGAGQLPQDLRLVVGCCYADTEFELALTDQHYTALRSWVEAAPPGWNANVA